MQEEDNVQLFKVTVGIDRKITTQHTLNRDIGFPTAYLKPASAVQWDTITTLSKIFREGRLLEEDEFRTLGANLYEFLLNNPVGDLINRIISEKSGFDKQEGAILRLELEFEEDEYGINSDKLEFLSWPWEYLYCWQQQMFLSEVTQLVLTRRLFLRKGENKRDLLIKDRDKPRVLFVCASPKASPDEPQLSRVQSAILFEMFNEEPIRSKIDLLEPLLIANNEEDVQNGVDNDKLRRGFATWQAFKTLVATYRPNIIHFVGHGRFEKDKGEIAFLTADESHSAHWINQEAIARELKGIKEVRLVFLQACESGVGGKIANPYRAISGIASRLAAENIPAVVAMQSKISNKESNRFAKEFYTALLESRAIEAAVLQGREKLLQDLGDWSVSKAFGLPVLYLRSNDSILLPPKQKQRSTPNTNEGSLSENSNQFIGTPDSGYCPRCHAFYEAGVTGCVECGTPFFCSKCKRPIITTLKNEKARFCPYCFPPTPLALPPLPADTVSTDSFSRTGKTGPL
ncbi:MAG TPA: CHAT domain-containing protein [Ktedonobacteraceae bacterium]|nr:CHAT domain-containing protein [Ktedonobacteraceae bacterium]